MYRVIWLQRAIDGLAGCYLLAARNRLTDALNAAAEEVERELDRDPATAGESRSGDLRVLAALPLVVDFELFPDHRTAVVTGVRYVPPSRRR